MEISVEVYLCSQLGQARILYARRSYKEALRIFQDVLRYNPACIPDPRIGIGLCLWAMNHKAKAKAAWQRSLEVVSLYMLCFLRNKPTLFAESFGRSSAITLGHRVD